MRSRAWFILLNKFFNLITGAKWVVTIFVFVSDYYFGAGFSLRARFMLNIAVFSTRSLLAKLSGKQPIFLAR